MTTLLNPAVWLFAALLLVAATGAVKGRSSHCVWQRFLSVVCRRWVVAVLLLATAAGVTSRIVLGLRTPGIYMAHVAAVNTFVDHGPWDETPGRAAADAAVPWAPLNGAEACPAVLMSDRIPLFTARATVPTWLLLELPVVRRFGATALFVLVCLASLAALTKIVMMLRTAGGDVPLRALATALLAVCVFGWQPALAALRQGDAVLVAAALVVYAWTQARRERHVPAAFAACAATAIALPAAGAIVGISTLSRHALVAALGGVAAILSATILAGGSAAVLGYAETISFAVRTFGPAPSNYSLAGHLVAGGFPVIWLTISIGVCAALILACTRKDPEARFALLVLAGVFASPVVWSQDLVLLFVPAVVALRFAIASGAATTLAVLAGTLIPLSLPDQSATLIGRLIPGTPAGSPPVATLILLLFGAWLSVSLRTASDGDAHV